ncbi:hypothetical protein PQX77_015742 [Marasmius sp. AFHP31]|nr:hypothetical protein PQX77_015742 [Marasmius sp. AFHP31]
MLDLKKHFSNDLFNGSTKDFKLRFKPAMEGVSKASDLWENLISEEKDVLYPHFRTVGITTTITNNEGESESTAAPPTFLKIKEWQEECATWKKNNYILMGIFQLMMTHTAFEPIKKMMAADMWVYVKDTYGRAMLSNIYGDFLKTVTFTIDQNNPLGSIAKLCTYFEHLEVVGINMPELVKALILVQAVPKVWEAAASKCLYDYMHMENVNDTASNKSGSSSSKSSVADPNAEKLPLTLNCVQNAIMVKYEQLNPQFAS